MLQGVRLVTTVWHPNVKLGEGSLYSQKYPCVGASGRSGWRWVEHRAEQGDRTRDQGSPARGLGARAPWGSFGTATQPRPAQGIQAQATLEPERGVQ